MAKAIGTIGNVASTIISGTTFVDVISTPPKRLFGSTDGATNIRSGANLMGSGTSTAYQVTNGTTLTIFAMRSVQHGSAGGSVTAGMADAALGFQDSTAASNPVIFGTESTSTAHPLYYVAATAGTTVSFDTKGRVASQKYHFYQAAATANLTLTHNSWGYEA